MRGKFEGTYYKHQKDGRTLALIAGAADDYAFIQVITNDQSYDFRYPLSAYMPGDLCRIGDSVFSKDGIKLHIKENNLLMCGTITYTEPTPLRYDIMGPFKYFPMQCRHYIQSLHHCLIGNLTLNGEVINFTGGTGYIEGDSGTSFPKAYTWIQCNDFPQKACVAASVADIPFFGLHFRGCFCVIYCHGVEYRLATYLGARIRCCDGNQIIFRQGKLRLSIKIDAGTGHRLFAPEKGAMTREIRERIVSGAAFRLEKAGEVLFEQVSENASFEQVEDHPNR